MSKRTYRVVVRGYFIDLDESKRAELLASADRHDILTAAITDEGTLIYDRTLRNFSFRCVVLQSAEREDDAAVETARERAAGYLADHGIRHSELRATATSVDDMKIRRRR
jgi:hypothetical protein